MDPHETSRNTLVGLVGLTLLMLVVGWMWATKPLPSLTSYDDSSACTDTQIAAGQAVHPSEVVVSVFNAGARSGGAGDAMRKLLERGFAAGQTGNAGTAGVARVEIWADPSSPAALLVARQFGAGTRIVGGKPVLGDGIVVVVGDQLRNKWHPKVDSVVATQTAWICGPKLL